MQDPRLVRDFLAKKLKIGWKREARVVQDVHVAVLERRNECAEGAGGRGVRARARRPARPLNRPPPK